MKIVKILGVRKRNLHLYKYLCHMKFYPTSATDADVSCPVQRDVYDNEITHCKYIFYILISPDWLPSLRSHLIKVLIVYLI